MKQSGSKSWGTWFLEVQSWLLFGLMYIDVISKGLIIQTSLKQIRAAENGTIPYRMAVDQKTRVFCLVVFRLPLWKIWVSWDDDIPNMMGKNKTDVPNHQPVFRFRYCKRIFWTGTSIQWDLTISRLCMLKYHRWSITDRRKNGIKICRVSKVRQSELESFKMMNLRVISRAHFFQHEQVLKCLILGFIHGWSSSWHRSCLIDLIGKSPLNIQLFSTWMVEIKEHYSV